MAQSRVAGYVRMVRQRHNEWELWFKDGGTNVALRMAYNLSMDDAIAMKEELQALLNRYDARYPTIQDKTTTTMPASQVECDGEQFTSPKE